MSFFKITIETIEKLEKIPTADRLLKCTLQGMDFEFVVGKDSGWSIGDKCLYFPLDAILPDKIAEKLGVLGKLSGPKKNRIKTVKLRGQISQGLIGPLDLIPPGIESDTITEALGILKYEPPPKYVQGVRGTKVKIITLPAGQSVYDIEGADRNPAAVEQLALGNVSITEKMEGSNFSLTWIPDPEAYGFGEYSINSRKHRIVLDSNESRHPFADAALEYKMYVLMDNIVDAYGAENQIILYGEFCGPGVQGNIYKLKKPIIYLFDIKVGDHYLNPDEFNRLTDGYNTVPVLAHNVDLVQWLADQRPQDWDDEEQGHFKVKHASNGMSMINPKIRREGIVIRPMKGQYCPKLHGRLIIKQRSPEYLAKEK